MTYSEALDRGLKRSRDLVSIYRNSELAIADQLRLPVETIGEDGSDVLAEVLGVLSVDLEEHGPWDWRRDITDGRDKRIATAAVEPQALEVLLNAATQFGWRHLKIQVTSFGDTDKGVRDAFTSLLADRISRMLQAWRKDNVWNHEMETRYERMARQRAEDAKRSPA